MTLSASAFTTVLTTLVRCVCVCARALSVTTRECYSKGKNNRKGRSETLKAGGSNMLSKNTL